MSNESEKQLYLKVKEIYAAKIEQLEKELPLIKALLEEDPIEYSASECMTHLDKLKRLYEVCNTYGLYSDISNHLNALIEKRDISAINGPFSWKQLIQEGDLGSSQSMALYQAKKKWSRDQFPGISLSGCYFAESGENSVEVQVSEGLSTVACADMAQFLIENILLHTKPLDDGFIHLKLMEHTCSYSASYSILSDVPGQSAKLKAVRYGHSSYPFSGTLQEVLQYCAKHHYAP